MALNEHVEMEGKSEPGGSYSRASLRWNPEGKHQRGEDVAGVISVVLSFPSGKVNIATIPIREMK